MLTKALNNYFYLFIKEKIYPTRTEANGYNAIITITYPSNPKILFLVIKEKITKNQMNQPKPEKPSFNIFLRSLTIRISSNIFYLLYHGPKINLI